jgi:glycosyltransferase involved in cell wall biosynthesis
MIKTHFFILICNVLSICIPHYNYQNPKLFETLTSQAEQLHLNFELLIIDDASKEEHKSYLRKLNGYPYSVEFLEKNIGRSAIRNLLTEKAKFNWLLFLDGDSAIENPNFIKTYMENQDFDFVSGGRYYENQKPDKNYLLHWFYGTQIESKSKGQFHSCNFMIKKSVFEQIKFDEDLKYYGYEDVLFGLEARNKNLVLNYIDNPVKHQQLKNNALFLKDTETAINNLKLVSALKSNLNWAEEVKLIQKYQQLKRFGLSIFIPQKDSPLFKKIESNLIHSPKSNLLLLNIYKLSLYHALS